MAYDDESDFWLIVQGVFYGGILLTMLGYIGFMIIAPFTESGRKRMIRDAVISDVRRDERNQEMEAMRALEAIRDEQRSQEKIRRAVRDGVLEAMSEMR